MKCVPCVSGAHGLAGQGCSLRARLAHLTLLSPSTRVEEAAEEPPCIACTAELHALRLWDIVASSRGPRSTISNLSTRCMCALRAVRETARRNNYLNPVRDGECVSLSDECVSLIDRSDEVLAKQIALSNGYPNRLGYTNR